MAHVREPTADDARRLAEVHVASWRAAYQGLLPTDYLDALAVSDRLPWWTARLAAAGAPGSLLRCVAGDEDQLDGFSESVPDLTTPGVSRAEVRTFYLDPPAWGRGQGRRLMGAVVDALSALGYQEAVLWVHPANHRARRFYETLGWTPTGEQRREDVWGVVLPETGYERRLGDVAASAHPLTRPER